MNAKHIAALAANLAQAARNNWPAEIGGGVFTRDELASGAAALQAFPAMVAAMRRYVAGAATLGHSLDEMGAILSRIDSTPTAEPAAPTGDAAPPIGEVWHIAERNGGRVAVRDENGLFVAEVIAEDAPLVVEAPAAVAALAELLDAMPAPSSRKVSAAWDKARAVLGRIEAAAPGATGGEA